MVASLVASLALLGTALSVSAQFVGSAAVLNSCDQPVYLTNVPAAGGGQQQSSATLAPGQTWTHEWTALTNGDGWSIKLSMDPDSMENIMQYEYTFQNDGIIWYDLSCVNGSPFDGNWDLSANTDTCDPLRQAYRYSTDDQHGMQASCPQNNVITVNLCSTQPANGSSDASPSDSSVTSAPAPSETASSTGGWNLLSIGGIGNILADNRVAEVTPTTLATHTSPPAPVVPVITAAPEGNFLTKVDIAYVTEVVTYVANSRVKRHQHHAHGHQHQA